MTSVGSTATSTLDKALADCAAGGSRTVLIEGPTGCGKSALVDAVAERAAAAGATVLSAVAFPDEQDVALGVLRQLVNSDRSLALARSAAADPAAASRVEDAQAFCTALRELGRTAPVVLCVDDVQHADASSLAHLQYLARHARSARILVVVSASLDGESRDPAFTTELMRQPTFRRIRLGLLSAAEVGEAAQSRGLPRSGQWLHRVSGGNPLLMHALLDELETTGTEADEQFSPEADGPFSQAVTALLQRGGATVTDVARAAALLADCADTERIHKLLGLDAPAVARALARLRAAGLLDGTRFRHPAACSAVLDATDPVLRAELHRRTALVLRSGGSPAVQIADHLLAGAAHRGPWQAEREETEVLLAAAENLISADDSRRALRILEFAHEHCADARQAGDLAVRLAQITWRFNPAAAERYASAPAAALREEGPADGPTQPLVRVLLAQGRIADARELLGGQEPSEAGEGAAPRGATAVDAMLDMDAADGESLLRSTPLTHATVEPVSQALLTLIHSDQPERAVSWSRKLLEETDQLDAPGWSALFASLHGEALLRTGDLRGACTYAARALGALPERDGGTFRHVPVSILIRAHSAMGGYAEASRYADEPIPRRALGTLHGLALLRARGLHLLAGNQPQAALADFQEVGRLMTLWGVDRPAYLPWRTDAAEALVQLGRQQEAERLVLQQQGTADARRPWVRGITLQLRALTSSVPKQRIALLSQAVDELHRSGDRLTTARAMARLGQSLQAEGSTPAKGSTLVRTAWNLAKECEANALCRELLPDVPLIAPVREQTVRETGEPCAEAKLSSSEQRVATLAAQGLTNREISAKLFLTVSTVEQHLTRVYRKLRISCRGDLPMDLALGSRQPLDR